MVFARLCTVVTVVAVAMLGGARAAAELVGSSLF